MSEAVGWAVTLAWLAVVVFAFIVGRISGVFAVGGRIQEAARTRRHMLVDGALFAVRCTDCEADQRRVDAADTRSGTVVNVECGRHLRSSA